MRRAVLAATASALLVTGCSQPEEQRSSEDLRTFDVSDEAAPAPGMAPQAPPPPVSASSEQMAAPGIDVSAAPGVAFDYRYSFRLPTPRISEVQEAHATMCEKLGLERCRIIGMRYQLRGSDSIAAMLALKLDPTIARDFGKQATALVTAREGMLVDQEISGIDIGTRIDSATRDKARIEADVDRLEAELRSLGVRDPRRGELSARIDDLRRQLRGLDSTRDADRELLAGTPMVFNYGSGAVIPGFDKRAPLGDALFRAWQGFEKVLAGLIVIAASLLPIAALLLLGWWLYRRFAARRTAPEAGQEPREA